DEVAHRVARKVRANIARQRQRESSLSQLLSPNSEEPGESDPSAPDSLTVLARQELQEILEEEVGRLPEKYRAPLLLCYWEGKTHEEAAVALGTPRGSMGKRLAWAWNRL